MTQAVAKYAAKKMLSKQMKQYKDKEPAGQYDPYYEYRTDSRGRKRKMKKQIPAYIPSHDADVLARVRKTAYRLDCSLFSFLGIRFGIESVIGLIPFVGDGAGAAMALNTIRKCNKIEGGLPQSILLQMLIWVFIDFAVGLVPFVGDLLDASIKCNSKNCRILEQYLDKKYKPKAEIEQEKRRRDEARRSRIHYEPPAPATVYEDLDAEDDELPKYEAAVANSGAPRPYANEPVRPAAAAVRDERRGGTRPERSGSRGLFGGFGGQKRRPTDPEMAQNGRR